ncbi:12093_t:CDS:2 [Funneliformis mosseae]|uniref:12093_t:CDS:1 n=1 Tax=Funneliformis mosseae TaxID=27381 RepID=A0A9N9GEF8_FUNMO|nr:12093_t:CDS:2 [Funneliformis mosseae]
MSRIYLEIQAKPSTKVNVYLTEVSLITEINSLYQQFLKGNPKYVLCDTTCSRYQKSIYLRDDNTQLLLQEEEYMIEKLLKT